MDTFFWEARGAGAPPLRIQGRKVSGPEPDTWYELTLVDEATTTGLVRSVTRRELRHLRDCIEDLVEVPSASGFKTDA